MRRRIPLLAVLALVLAGGAATLLSLDGAAGRAAGDRRAVPARFQRGMALADAIGRHDHPEGVESARRLAALGADWIQMSPFAFQPRVDRPELRYPDFSTVQDRYVASLRSLDFHILLKPHIWSNQFWGGDVWRGDILMADDAAWSEWFDSYRDFLVHYARFAEERDIEMLCLGLEYVASSREHEAGWRDVARAVRGVYTGEITYAAHFDEEAESIGWWDALDVIGVNIYPDLIDGSVTTAEELEAAWEPVVARLDSLAARWGKEIVITEIGFRSVPSAADEPWRWVDGREPASEEAQAVCYEAAFRALWGRPWLRGIYWWKWHIDPHAGGAADPGFTPQGKLAAGVVGRWYGGPQAPGAPVAGDRQP